MLSDDERPYTRLMRKESARRPRWSLAWPWVALASIVALIGLAGLWWLAIPRTGGACFAIYPAPPGCSDSRIPAAVGWSVGLVVLLGVNVWAALSRHRLRAGVPALSSLATVVVAALAYRAVLYA